MSREEHIQKPSPTSTNLDSKTLSQEDEGFIPHTWDELRETVDTNKLDLLRRYPSDLRRYQKWSSDTRTKYGSVAAYVCQERLHWAHEPSHKAHGVSRGAVPGDGEPFANGHDLKILLNDWPYAIPADTSHIVVWLRSPLAVSQSDGQLLPEVRRAIQRFVDLNFVTSLALQYGAQEAKDRVLWFKNWSAIQSVGALEHFHVLVRGAGTEQLHRWTEPS